MFFNIKAESYEIILPSGLREEFIIKMRELCGADRISEKIVKCTHYQISIIESYLSNPNNKFKNSSERAVINKKAQETEGNSDNGIKIFKRKNSSDLSDDNSDYRESLAKLKIDTNLSSNNRFECHHKLHSKSAQLDLILAEQDLTNVKADCIVSPVHVSSLNGISEAIKVKAGQFYTNELKEKLEEYKKSKNESKKVKEI